MQNNKKEFEQGVVKFVVPFFQKALFGQYCMLL